MSFLSTSVRRAGKGGLTTHALFIELSRADFSSTLPYPLHMYLSLLSGPWFFPLCFSYRDLEARRIDSPATGVQAPHLDRAVMSCHTPPLVELPQELVEYVTSELPAEDLRALRQTCRAIFIRLSSNSSVHTSQCRPSCYPPLRACGGSLKSRRRRKPTTAESTAKPCG